MQMTVVASRSLFLDRDMCGVSSDASLKQAAACDAAGIAVKEGPV